MLDLSVEELDDVGKDMRGNLPELLVVLHELVDALQHAVLVSDVVRENTYSVRILLQLFPLDHARRFSCCRKPHLITERLANGPELIVEVPQLNVHVFREHSIPGSLLPRYHRISVHIVNIC